MFTAGHASTARKPLGEQTFCSNPSSHHDKATWRPAGTITTAMSTHSGCSPPENAALFRLAGERDPYRQAPLGVITQGAWADLLLIDGNPLEDLNLLTDPAKQLSVIVKNGQTVKNIL